MTPVNGVTTEPRSGSTAGEPKTYAEAVALVQQLMAQQDDAILHIKRLEARIDADFLASEQQLEEYEREREAVQRRLERIGRRIVYVGDTLMPALQKSDKTAEASRHRSACETLEYRMRPLRRRAKDALLELLEAFNDLDKLYAEHKRHAGQYSATLEALALQQTPNVHRAVELPEHARARDHREGMRALWDALSSRDNPEAREVERFAERLHTLLAPYEPPVPPTFDEED